MTHHIRISMYKSGKNDPEIKIDIPMGAFHISRKLIPLKVKTALEKEGIDLSAFCEQSVGKPPPKGLLIGIENKGERIEISAQ